MKDRGYDGLFQPQTVEDGLWSLSGNINRVCSFSRQSPRKQLSGWMRLSISKKNADEETAGIMMTAYGSVLPGG